MLKLIVIIIISIKNRYILSSGKNKKNLLCLLVFGYKYDKLSNLLLLTKDKLLNTMSRKMKLRTVCVSGV